MRALLRWEDGTLVAVWFNEIYFDPDEKTLVICKCLDGLELSVYSTNEDCCRVPNVTSQDAEYFIRKAFTDGMVDLTDYVCPFEDED